MAELFMYSPVPPIADEAARIAQQFAGQRQQRSDLVDLMVGLHTDDHLHVLANTAAEWLVQAAVRPDVTLTHTSSFRVQRQGMFSWLPDWMQQTQPLQLETRGWRLCSDKGMPGQAPYYYYLIASQGLARSHDNLPPHTATRAPRPYTGFEFKPDVTSPELTATDNFDKLHDMHSEITDLLRRHRII